MSGCAPMQNPHITHDRGLTLPISQSLRRHAIPALGQDEPNMVRFDGSQYRLSELG